MVVKINYLAVLFSALILLPVPSCKSNEEEFIFPNLVSRGSMNGVIYDDTIYYFDENTLSIKYQNINSVSDTGHPLINDSLIEAEANPFTDMSIGVYMLIDYEGTARNNNVPIIIVAYKDFSDLQRPHYLILSFNTKNNNISIIKDNIYDNVQTIHMYKNVIYYTINKGSNGYDMCRVDIDGKNFTMKNNPNKCLYRIHTIYKDKIYYSLDDLDKVYSCNLDFKEDKYLVNAVLKSDYFIYNDYLYYYSNLIKNSLDGFPVYSADLMRSPISNPSKNELILPNLSVGLNNDSKFYYYKSSPRIIANDYFDDGTNVLNVLDLNSGESTIFYDLGDNNSITYYEILSDTWVYFYSSDYSPKILDSSAAKITEYFAINTNTKEKVKIPR